jgi:DNA invertase Pin-like site-specific DNA recombinase
VKTAIIYRRVSTSEQGKSGLGLAAQLEGCELFAEQNGYQVVEVVTEVASGAKSDREGLMGAIEKAKKEGHTILVFRLDRLSRSLTQISQLVDAGAPFIACELGERVSPFMVNLFGLLAQNEREKISERTRLALARCKERGMKLGGPNLELARKRSTEVCVASANNWAESLRPTITRLHEMGVTRISHVAQYLNDLKVPARRGGTWSPQQVKNLVKRLDMAALG